MRKGWKVKTRKRRPVKPPGPNKDVDHTFDAHPLTGYMRQHLEWMKVNGYAEATLRTRRTGILRFIAWCAERSIEDPREITRPMLERYQHYLFYYRKPDGQPMTLGTQHGFLAPLKTFFKWLTRANYIAFNPASEMDLPRMGKRLPRNILTVQEAEAILMEATPSTIEGLRDRAMLETLYSTGLRRMELPHLMLYDVDLARCVVFVREGKGKRDRVIPIGARAVAWVEKYLLEARPLLLTGTHETLFVSDYGAPLSPEQVAAKVRRYKAFAGVSKPGAVHLFRHACATHMLEGGADIRFIQAMLGHANLATTEIYTHVSIDKLKAIHAATHPARLARQPMQAGAAGQVASAGDLLAALVAEAVEEDREDGA